MRADEQISRAVVQDLLDYTWAHLTTPEGFSSSCALASQEKRRLPITNSFTVKAQVGVLEGKLFSYLFL